MVGLGVSRSENHSGTIPLLDMGVGPVYAPGEEDEMGEQVSSVGADRERGDADVWTYEGTVGVFDLDEARESYVRLSAAAMNASKAVVDEVEAILFAKRVRLPGSGAVARLFGQLEAWQAARVERQAQAAFERGWV